MGIPSIKYIKPQSIPSGYQEKKRGTIQKTDRIWSTSEGKYLDPAIFVGVLGEDVNDFWNVITKIDNE